MAGPVRRIDRLAGALVSVFGAGLFTGLAPASAVAGWWLLAGLLLAAALAVLFALSTPESAPGGTGTVLGISARVAAGIAIAGTFGAYVLPARPQVAAVGLAVVAAAAVLLVPRPPVEVTRIAAAVVLAVPVVVAVACFTIAPVALPVVPPDDLPGADAPLGLLPAAALLFVCFAGDRPPRRRDRLVVVAVVFAVCAAVAAGALRQLGGQRLALAEVPLRDALTAADAAPLAGLLTAGVAVGCLFAIGAALREAGDLAGTVRAGRPRPLAVGVAAGIVAFGVLILTPTQALVGAAVLLLAEAGFRLFTGRGRQA